MEAEKLKLILDALANTTVQAREAFYVYLTSQVGVDLIIAGSVLWAIWFTLSRVLQFVKWMRQDDTGLLILYNRVNELADPGIGCRETTRWITEREVRNLIEKLEKKINVSQHTK